jgi:hypothetical protein
MSFSRFLIELKNMLIYTSDTNHPTLSQSFINDLNKKHFWNCLCYLPNANMTV